MTEEPTEEDLAFGERVANNVSISLVAVAKTVMLGNEDSWKMPLKHYVSLGFIDAEDRTKIYLEPEDRRFVFDLVVESLEKYHTSNRKVNKNDLA